MYILCIICVYIIKKVGFKSILFTWNVIETFTNASECFIYMLKRCFQNLCWLTPILDVGKIFFHVTFGRNCVHCTSVGTKYSKGTMLVGATLQHSFETSVFFCQRCMMQIIRSRDISFLCFKLWKNFMVTVEV